VFIDAYGRHYVIRSDGFLTYDDKEKSRYLECF